MYICYNTLDYLTNSTWARIFVSLPLHLAMNTTTAIWGSAANTGNYAHFVFNTLDQDNSGIINFEVRIFHIHSRVTLKLK